METIDTGDYVQHYLDRYVRAALAAKEQPK